MKKLFALLVIIFIALSFIEIPKVFAQETTTTPAPTATINPRLKEAQERMENAKPRLQQVQETVKQNLTQNLCEAVTARVDEKIAQYETLKTAEFPRLTRILTTLKERSVKLKEKGFNTTKLDEDIKVLETKVNDAKARYEAFITKLRETKLYTCGSSQGQFRAALLSAKQAHRESIASIRAARQYIRLTIMADLRALRTEENRKSDKPQT